MKKHQTEAPRKLRLCGETLRHLASAELPRVVAGVSGAFSCQTAVHFVCCQQQSGELCA